MSRNNLEQRADISSTIDRFMVGAGWTLAAVVTALSAWFIVDTIDVISDAKEALPDAAD